MSNDTIEKLPTPIVGIIIFMSAVLISLVIYWWLYISGTVAFV